MQWLVKVVITTSVTVIKASCRVFMETMFKVSKTMIGSEPAATFTLRKLRE